MGRLIQPPPVQGMSLGNNFQFIINLEYVFFSVLCQTNISQRFSLNPSLLDDNFAKLCKHFLYYIFSLPARRRRRTVRTDEVLKYQQTNK